MPAADDLTRTVNIIEGLFWLGLAAVLLTIARRKTNRADKLTAAGVLAAFGVSDFVEARTGAWWDPPWLLAWKAACLAVLGVLAARHLRRIRRRREEPGPAVG